MLTLKTEAEIDEDGTLKAKAPPSAPRGRHQVVIIIGEGEGVGAPGERRRLPDLTEFRSRLAGRPYPGNSVVDARDEER
jgi:hypothetical protein